MALPFKGQCADVPKAPGGQRDWLTTGENSLDNVRRQEHEPKTVPNVAGIDAFMLCYNQDRADLSCAQLAEPAMRPCNEVN